MDRSWRRRRPRRSVTHERGRPARREPRRIPLGPGGAHEDRKRRPSVAPILPRPCSYELHLDSAVLADRVRLLVRASRSNLTALADEHHIGIAFRGIDEMNETRHALRI